MNNKQEEFKSLFIDKIVRVNWIDSASCANWVLDTDMDAEPTQITSVGFCIRETEDYIVIAQNVCQKPCQESHIMAIPRGAIMHIDELKYYVEY